MADKTEQPQTTTTNAVELDEDKLDQVTGGGSGGTVAISDGTSNTKTSTPYSPKT